MFFSSPTCRHLFMVCWLAFLLIPSSSFAQEDIVSVRLLRDASPRTMVISSEYPLQLFSGIGTSPILELPPREKLTLTTRTDRVYLTSEDGGIFATTLYIVPPEGDKTSSEIPEITIELPGKRPMISDRSYHGSLKIDVETRPSPTLRIINYLPVENYVASVLSSEFGYTQLEGSKALALCIRTLTLRHLTNQSGPEYAVPDNESWQVYKGTNPITPTAIQATQETFGQVLLYEDELIEAVYFASSGGFTANNEDVWNASEVVPYLRGREDEYDNESPHHIWNSAISRSDLLAHLSNEYDLSVTGFSIHDINKRDQRVRSILLSSSGNEQKIIPGNEFRHVVNRRFGRDRIKSTMFKINTQPGQYLFSGGGFGHGVGLNQWGALELSKQGWSYEEILNYYYGDIEIDTYLPGMAIPPDALVSSNVPFIDMSQPLPPQSIPESGVFIEQTVEESDFSLDISSRLFGDEDGEIESEEIRGESQGGRRAKRRRTHIPDKIVGWTKTTEPANVSAASDSTQTKTKRRTTGW